MSDSLFSVVSREVSCANIYPHLIGLLHILPRRLLTVPPLLSTDSVPRELGYVYTTENLRTG